MTKLILILNFLILSLITLSGQGSMRFVFFEPGSVSNGCTSNSDCDADIVCFALEYTPGFTGVATSYTTGFFATCVAGNNPYLNATSCTMTDNSGFINGCASLNAILFNLSGNNGGLSVTAGVPVILHQICFDLAPGEQTTITRDELTDLTVSINLSGGGPVDDFATFVPSVLSHNVACMLLPVEFSSFEVIKKADQSELVWTTVSEINNDYFGIEWSLDGIHFEEIGKVSGNGNSDVEIQYVFNHSSPVEGRNFYRLRQVDFDRKFEFSDIRWVEFKNEDDTNILQIVPNPVSEDFFYVLFDSERKEEQMDYTISDLSGKVVRTGTAYLISGKYQIGIGLLNPGAYILNINSKDQFHHQKWIKI